MENLKSNEQRAKNAILLIWIILVLEIVKLISSYLQYNLLQTATNGGYISDEAITANNSRELIISILHFIAYVISVITFIMWFRRAYYNLHQKVNHLSHSEGWAVGSWFVPIISLYLPYQIMKEIYVETKELLNKKGLSEKVNYTTSYLGWWWTLWIIGIIISNLIFGFKHNTIDNYIVLTIAHMGLNILRILYTLITIKIIKDYSKVEPLLNEIGDDVETITPTNAFPTDEKYS